MKNSVLSTERTSGLLVGNYSASGRFKSASIVRSVSAVCGSLRGWCPSAKNVV